MTVLGSIVTLQATVSTPAQGAEPSDSAAVRSVWKSIDAMWNAHDAERFSRLYTEDASLAFVDRGESLDSRAAILEFFTERFPNNSPDLRHRTTVREVRDVASGVLAVDGKVEILRIGPEGSAEPAVLKTFAIFAVMTRKAEGLQIRALRIYEMSAAAGDT